MTDTRHDAGSRTATTRGRPRARKGEGALLRDEILDAAESLLVEKGHPDAVSVRAIARRVGVSPPSIYLHFADKDEVFFHCCNRRFGEMLERMVAAAEQHDDVMDQLEAVGRAYVSWAMESPEQYRVMFLGPVPSAIDDDELESLPGTAALTMTADLVRSGIESGALRSDIDPDAAAVALWASVHGTSLVLISKRDDPSHVDLSEQAVVDLMVGMIRQGIAA